MAWAVPLLVRIGWARSLAIKPVPAAGLSLMICRRAL